MRLAAWFLVIFTSELVFGSGGMIGGGEIGYRSLVSCNVKDAPGQAQFLWVIKEIDFHGRFIPSATLRVALLDRKKNPLQFLVSHHLQMPATGRLELWQYDVSSVPNSKIGELRWNPQTGVGRLSLRQDSPYELNLSNCVFD